MVSESDEDFFAGKRPWSIIKDQAAEKYAKGNYRAIFINKDQKYHDKLSQEIQRAGWSPSVETTGKKLCGRKRGVLKSTNNN
jgi:hypothetical protein